MAVTVKEINILLSKITEIDPEQGAYIKRHINLNRKTNCFEYDGNESVINVVFKKMKESVEEYGFYED